MTNHNRLFLLLLISFVLSSCTQPAQDPKTVADKYWQYMQTGNISEAEKLVSTNSGYALQEHNNRLSTNTQINNGETTTIINTTITTIDPDNNYRHTETFNTVLVLQQGQWKVDAEQSQIPAAPSEKEKERQQLTEDLSKSMQENIESMDDAVNQGMQMLNEALRDGSKEMGDSLLHMMDELNITMQESIEKMKQRREQQRQEQQQVPPSPSQPDPRRGEGMI
jgi:CHASE3 domain sensor protein